jgi:hypothetical protein
LREAGGDLLKEVCKRLIKCDPDIAEIILFGSSVYAPEHSRDLDLLVFTGKVKDYDVYLNATCEIYDELGFQHNLDVIPREIGKPLNESFGRSVLGGFKVLYGTGECLKEAAKSLGDMTFKEAKAALKAAADYLKLALRSEDPMVRDRHVRESFDSLFHAAGMASMAYLSTPITRWGIVKARLPSPYKGAFNDFIKVLHIKYFYNGEYPKDRVQEEFKNWLKKVEDYVINLEANAAKRRI